MRDSSNNVIGENNNNGSNNNNNNPNVIGNNSNNRMLSSGLLALAGIRKARRSYSVTPNRRSIVSGMELDN